MDNSRSLYDSSQLEAFNIIYLPTTFAYNEKFNLV